MATSRAKTLENKLSLDFFNKITDDFSDQRLIGTGSFGSVYKGILEDGGEVAVKKLGVNAPVPHKTMFDNEVQNMKALEHENIVKLVAYCSETVEKADLIDGEWNMGNITETVLCYEYFPKGSLDKHIFGDSNTIRWNMRFEIIKGICNGVKYLHNLSRPVWHLGLKPQNILLDGNMVPKIADFGFSRILGGDQTHRITGNKSGPVGYMAPEHLFHGQISARADIYSLGLIILEITTREKNSSSNDQMSARRYIEEVEKNWTLDKIMSEYTELDDDDDDDDGLSQVKACIDIGLECVGLRQFERPSIQKIINKLNGQ